MKTALKGKRWADCSIVFSRPSHRSVAVFFFLISIFSFLFYIFQIQITDIIKVTTQKQGGLANNSRAIAVVRSFINKTFKFTSQVVVVCWRSPVSFDAVPCFPMPSVVYSWYLSIKIRFTFVQVFASCRRYELNITGQNCSFIFVRDVIHVWRSSSRFCWQKSNNICRDRYR